MDQTQPKSIPEDPDGFVPAYSHKDDCTGCHFEWDSDFNPCSACGATYRPEGRTVIFVKKEKNHA